jgi:hypothetical protein
MGLPLYRLETGFAYDGVNISRQTMSNWVIRCGMMYLSPLYERLKTHLLEETTLNCDETTVQVLNEPNRAATTKSYEWVYRTSGYPSRNIVIYEYKMTRGHEHPEAFLKNYKGLLHTDGYHAYHNLSSDIIVVGCWAHLRRKFEDIIKNTVIDKRKGSNAEIGLAYINALFRNERAFAKLSPDEKLKKRLKLSKPVSDSFFDWSAQIKALPKSPLGIALKYALTQRKYLENIYVDGRAEVSNNRAERSVKPFVMGRKAWLFSNSQSGADASSILYSIIETAKENGLHPYRYLEFLLEILPKTNRSSLDQLLPWSDSLPERCHAPLLVEELHNAKKKGFGVHARVCA